MLKNYDAEELNRELNIAGRHPDLPEQLDRWRGMSRAVRERRKCRLDLAYGDGALETVDFFPSESGSKACLVFIHGGYWRSLDKEVFSFVADGFVEDGPSVAVLNYPLVPASTIDEIVESARRAMLWLADQAGQLGIDPKQITICGHSSGGHLAAMLALTDWSAYGLAEPPFAKASSIGGIYDLETIRHSYINQDVKLDEPMALRNSPIRLLHKVPQPFVLAIAEKEAAEFQRQHRELWSEWQKLGQDIVAMDLHGEDHFSVLDLLTSTQSRLNQALR